MGWGGARWVNGMSLSITRYNFGNMQIYQAQQKPYARRPGGDSLSHFLFCFVLLNLRGRYYVFSAATTSSGEVQKKLCY